MSKLAITLLYVLCFLSYCGQQDKNTITIAGSESMQRSFIELSKNIRNSTDSLSIDVQGGGSVQGIEKLQNGEANIALCSNENLCDSIALSDGFKKVVTGYDAVVLIVNKKNIVRKLTDQQIKDVFSGKIKSWTKFGGLSGDVIPITRDDESGSQDFFANYFGISEIKGLGLKSNAEIVEYVQNNEGAIGFVSMSYYDTSVRGLEIYNSVKNEFVEPTYYQLANGQYQLGRKLVMYINPEHKLANSFADYVSSTAGQTILSLTGMIPKSIFE